MRSQKTESVGLVSRPDKTWQRGMVWQITLIRMVEARTFRLRLRNHGEIEIKSAYQNFTLPQ